MSQQLPQYQCHKKVRASKIIAIEKNPDGSAHLILETEGFPPYLVSKEWMQRHTPQPLGYFVMYDDTYTSWSPAEAFIDGYTLISK